MKSAENPKRFKFIVLQTIIIAPVFLALLVYLKQGIEMNRTRIDFKKITQMEEELYHQYENLLYEKEMLSSPSRIERIAVEKLGFVSPDSINFKRVKKTHYAMFENE